MKRLIALMLILVLAACCLPGIAFAKKAKQMNDDVPVWTEETVRQYALDYIEGKSMSRLWGYYDLQIRRYMPMTTYEALLIDLEWLTGEFVALGSYRSFEEPEEKLKVHVLHLCMEKQDLDMYFTHKNKEDDWEIMALEFVPAEKETVSANAQHAKIGVAPVTTDVSVVTANHTLDGVLTVPGEATAEAPVPACVFVHDFGANDRDMTMGQTKFFKDLAEAFAEMGVASIRYDSRAYAYPDETFETVWDEAVEDALAACEMLTQNELVDQQRIVVVGLGFGGMVAPRIAQQSEGKCTAMLLIGSEPLNLLKWYCNNKAEEYAAMPSSDRKSIQSVLNNGTKYVSEEQFGALSLFGHSGSYFLEDMQYNAVSIIKNLRIPTYVAQGRRDPLVSEDEGRRAYARMRSATTRPI